MIKDKDIFTFKYDNEYKAFFIKEWSTKNGVYYDLIGINCESMYEAYYNEKSNTLSICYGWSNPDKKGTDLQINNPPTTLIPLINKFLAKHL